VRDQQRQRVSHQQADESGGHGDDERFDENLGVDKIAEEKLIILQRKSGFLRKPAKFTGKTERGNHHNQAGQQKKHRQVNEWRPTDKPFCNACRT
jgi:hypothetical protein